MAAESTSKMLLQLTGLVKSNTSIVREQSLEQLESIQAPNLTPSSQMELLLNNILGTSHTNKSSPMD